MQVEDPVLSLISSLDDTDSSLNFLIISQTTLRRDALKQKASTRESPINKASFVVFDQGVRQLFLKITGISAQALVHLERKSYEAIIFEVIEENPSLFPNLLNKINEKSRGVSKNQSKRLVPPFISYATNFLDRLRADFGGVEIISQVIDELGNTIIEKEELAELILLDSFYRDKCIEKNSFDSIGLEEALLEKLDSFSARKEFRIKNFPDCIILEQPSELSKLQLRIVEKLCNFSQLVVVCEDSLNDCSEDISLGGLSEQRIIKELRTFEKIEFRTFLTKERGALELSKSLFNLEQVELDKELISSWLKSFSFRTKKEEVSFVAEDILKKISSGESVSNFQVSTFNLDEYIEYIDEEFLKRNINFHYRKGYRFLSTATGNHFLVFLELIANRNLLSLFNYIETGIFPKQKKENLELDHFKLFINKHFLSLKSLKIKDFLESFPRGTLDLEGDFKAILNLILDFEKFFESLDKLQESKLKTNYILKKFRENRFKLSQIFNTNQSNESLALIKHHAKLNIYSLRAIRKKLNEEFSFLDSISQVNKLSTELDIEDSYLHILSSFRTLRIYAPKKEGGVILSEFLDVRAMHGLNSYLLGLNSENFPKNRQKSVNLTLNKIEEKLSNKEEALNFESYFLLSELLKKSQNLCLSFSVYDKNSKQKPAFILNQLAHLLSWENTKHVNKIELKVENRLGELQVKNLTSKFESNKTFYDTNFFELEKNELRALLQEVRPKNFLKDGKNYFSISDLELYTECPQRFFFKKILGLKDLKNLEVSPYIELGNIVHQAIEKISKTKKDINSSLGSELKKIAVGIFAASDLDWEGVFELNKIKNDTLQGLEKEGKRGPLAAFLHYNEILKLGSPIDVEFEFSDKKGNAYEISSDLRLSGKIDRIDLCNESGKLSIWDYKTGLVDTIEHVDSGQSLQIPLYASFLAETRNKEIERGGQFSLSNGNRNDDYLEHPKNGVLVEHLAVGKKGRSYVIDSSQVSARLENSKNKCIEINNKINSGDFSQKLETTACSYCEFKRMCKRDEAVIERKEVKALIQNRTPNLFLDLEGSHSFYEFKKEDHKQSKKLSEKQAQAIDPKRNVVLSAGAGSGKTTVLQHRFISLLLAGAKIDSIIAITFTEKAAAEIKERIEEGIISAIRTGQFNSQELTNQQKRVLIEAIGSLENAHIGTIHSLCSKIISMDTELSGIENREGILTDGKKIELIRESIEEVLSHQIEKIEPYLNNLINSGISYRVLRKRLESIVSQKSLIGELKQSLFDQLKVDEEKVIEQRANVKRILQKVKKSLVLEVSAETRDFLEELTPELSYWIDLNDSGDLKKLTKEELDVFKNILISIVSVINLVNSIFEKEPNKNEDLIEEKFVNELILLKNKVAENYTYAKKVSKDNPRNFLKELKDYLEQIKFEVISGDLSKEETSILLQQDFVVILSLVSDTYQQKKFKQELIDFDDMIDISHQMLCADFRAEQFTKEQISYFSKKRKAMLLRLEEKYQHLMIDEFQDTDTHQWEILSSFFREEEPKTIFIVGDPKQAIYSFRGGDVSVFNRVEEELCQNGALKISLDENYRSTAQVLDFVNPFFNQLFASDFYLHQEKEQKKQKKHKGAVGFEAMQAKRQETKNSGVYYLKSESYRNDSNEVENLANFISLLLKEKIEEISFSTGTEQKKLAVICRRALDLKKLATQLDNLGIDYEISHGAEFFKRDEVLQIENLLRLFSDERNSSLYFAAVLRSTLFGFSDLDLLKLKIKLQNKNLDFTIDNFLSFNEASEETYCEARARFIEIGYFSRAFCPSLFIREVVKLCQLKAIYYQTGLAEAYLNILALIECFREAELKGEFASIKEAAKWIRLGREYSNFEAEFAYQDFIAKEEKASNNGKSENQAVTLMTIHKSKGLEFPLVILPFMSNSNQLRSDFSVSQLEEKTLLAIKVEDDEDGYQRKNTLINAVIEKEQKILETAEERRVFYVACTRARDYLCFSFPLNQTFLKEQELKKKKEENKEEKNTKLFNAQRRDKWFGEILSLDDTSEPSFWELEGGYTVKVL